MSTVRIPVTKPQRAVVAVHQPAKAVRSLQSGLASKNRENWA